MDLATALQKEFPTTSDTIFSLMSKVRKKELGQKEALTKLVSTTEFLDPLLFLLFTSDTNLSDVISYKEYAAILRNKSIKQNNQALYNLSKLALEFTV